MIDFSEIEELARTNNYHFDIRNHVLIYGPPKLCLNGSPPQDNEVYITGLPKNLNPIIIIKKFSEISKIYKFRIQLANCFNKNIAFVHYNDVDDAKIAVKTLNNFEILPGFKINVQRPKYNKRLHVGYFDKSLSKEEITDYFMAITKNLSKVTIPEDEIKGNFKNPGFCSLLFKTGRDALVAKNFLVKESSLSRLKLGNREIRTIEFFNGFNEITFTNKTCICNKKPVFVINTYGEDYDTTLILTNFKEDSCVALFMMAYTYFKKKYDYLRFTRDGNFLLLHFSEVHHAEEFKKNYEEFCNLFMGEFSIPGTVSRLIRPIKRNDVQRIIENKNSNDQFQLPNININLEELFSILNLAK